MITIGITTFNRLSTLRRMAASLYDSDLPYPYSIRIYDDASTDYNIDELREIFPDAKTIHKHTENWGADANTLYMYRDFLKTDDDIFFNADSDLIYNTKWMVDGVDLLDKTDGVLSLFNTSTHASCWCDDVFCIKSDLGAAGTMFRRDNLQRFLDYYEKNNEGNIENEGIDFYWSRYFKMIGVRLLATKVSLVQHIGFDGYNSSMDCFDYGTGFKVDSILNGQLVNDSLEEKFSHRNSGRKKYTLFPFEKISKGARIVVYGAGATGQDYVKQIKNSGYCYIVAVVDKNYEMMNGVCAPNDLPNMDFDNIVIASINEMYISEIKKDIEDKYPFLAKKIIYREKNSTIRL